MSPRARWPLVAVLVGLVAVALVLIWNLRSSDTGSGETKTPMRAPRGSTPPLPRLRPPPAENAPPPEDDTRALGTSSSGARDPRMSDALTDANQRLKTAAGPCVNGRDLDGMLEQSLSFTYTLGLANDTARIDDVKQVKSTVEDADIARCILERVEALEWRVEGFDPVEKRLYGAFKLGDL